MFTCVAASPVTISVAFTNSNVSSNSMSALLTIAIPTYNRPEQLAKTVRLLRRHSPPIPIIIADGSYEEHLSRNATCREIGNDIEYFQLPSEPSETPWQNYGRRV